jgi:serine/threonine-protein kinase haspin
VSFPPDQKYALILLEDGGDDLETFKFSPSSSWEQVAAVFWQVAQALATAEEELEFEVGPESATGKP